MPPFDPPSKSNDDPRNAVTPDDHVLPFQLGEEAGTSAVRGHVVRLGRAIDTILENHNTSPDSGFNDALSQLVGQAGVLVTMMGTALKFDGKLIFQVQGDGPVSMIVADYDVTGDLRATASVAGDKRLADDVAGMRALIGNGHIAMTVDQGPDMERYQGVTPLDGENLEDAIVSYFQQSEQIPTAVRLAVGKVSVPGGREYWRAGGIISQFMPGEGGSRERGESVLMAEDDQESWTRAETLLSTTEADELLDPQLPAENLLYRLFHEEGVRIFEPRKVRATCGCNADKITAVLQRYGKDDLADMMEDGFIRVSCDFCRRDYRFDEQGRPDDDLADEPIGENDSDNDDGSGESTQGNESKK